MAENSQFKVRVGQNIRNQRIAVRMSMKELGKALNLSESMISKYENGDIKYLDIEMLGKFADALSCSRETLLGWKDGEHKAYNDNVKAKRLAKHNKLYEQLTFENQKQADEYIKFLLSQQKSQNTRTDNDKPN